MMTMTKENLSSLLNHFVHLNCKNSIVWKGRILEIYEDGFRIKDKFGKIVLISYDNVLSVQDLGAV